MFSHRKNGFMSAMSDEGWREVTRIPASQGIIDVRAGVRDEAGAIWLVVVAERPDEPGWEHGFGLAHRPAPTSATEDPGWRFFPTPLTPTGPVDPITTLAAVGSRCFVGGASGLAAIDASEGLLGRSERAVTDLRVVGGSLHVLATDGHYRAALSSPLALARVAFPPAAVDVIGPVVLF